MSIGGNKGRPLSALLLDEGATDPIALAVSSFQLESVVHFRPHIAVLLNINEAHLDRHRSIAEYVRIKSRIFMNHRPDDVLILPYDDPRLRSLARKHHGRTLFVSRSQPVDRGAWLEHDAVLLNLEGEPERIDSAAPYIAATGAFAEDFLCAILAAWLCGISTADLAQLICGEGGGPCTGTIMAPAPSQRKG
jgi:UDP-N-acetylmuramoylalanine--D-glutamate ligase